MRCPSPIRCVSWAQKLLVVSCQPLVKLTLGPDVVYYTSLQNRIEMLGQYDRLEVSPITRILLILNIFVGLFRWNGAANDQTIWGLLTHSLNSQCKPLMVNSLRNQVGGGGDELCNGPCRMLWAKEICNIWPAVVLTAGVAITPCSTFHPHPPRPYHHRTITREQLKTQTADYKSCGDPVNKLA